jgi:hypothetical protein
LAYDFEAMKVTGYRVKASPVAPIEAAPIGLSQAPLQGGGGIYEKAGEIFVRALYEPEDRK